MADATARADCNEPYDFPDIPGSSGLSSEYINSLRTSTMREAIARRQAELEVRKATEALHMRDGAAPKG